MDQSGRSPVLLHVQRRLLLSITLALAAREEPVDGTLQLVRSERAPEG